MRPHQRRQSMQCSKHQGARVDCWATTGLATPAPRRKVTSTDYRSVRRQGWSAEEQRSVSSETCSSPHRTSPSHSLLRKRPIPGRRKAGGASILPGKCSVLYPEAWTRMGYGRSWFEDNTSQASTYRLAVRLGATGPGPRPG